jgi:polysaccharide export outer membrane protein
MKIIKILPIAILILCAAARADNGQPYIIGVEDRLSVSFWQEPDLNSDVRVRNDGKITLPVIGEIQAAGLSAAQLSESIVDQMAYYNPGISQSTVIVTEYNSRKIVLTGAVNDPGTYSFEWIPNILDVIRQAGGALPEADLSSVTIIRQSGESVNVIDVDLLKNIKDGDLSSLPKLEPNDMINVPQSPYGVAAELVSGQSFKGKNIYFIYGAVSEPGVKSLTDDIELVDAIAAAGGSTDAADLKNIRVIIKDVQYSSILKFDFSDYIETGRPIRYQLKPEDTIFVPFRQESTFWSRLPDLLVPGLATAIVTTLLVNALSTGE